VAVVWQYDPPCFDRQVNGYAVVDVLAETITAELAKQLSEVSADSLK
jgi:hypothetical protein